MDIADIQVEVNKGHATQFVAGTRSATDGLLDLSGNGNHGGIINMTYDDNAYMIIDGSLQTNISQITLSPNITFTDTEERTLEF